MAKSVTVNVTPEMRESIIRSVDWDRVNAMTKEEIEQDVARDPDVAPFTDADGMAIRLQMIRKRFGLSQAQFADRFHIPVATLRDWEQARRQPDAAVWAYIQVIEREPAAVLRALGEAA
jgi:putative transcriptional regulator